MQLYDVLKSGNLNSKSKFNVLKKIYKNKHLKQNVKAPIFASFKSSPREEVKVDEK